MRNHTIASAWSTFRVYNLRLPTARRQRKLVFSSLRLPIRARQNTGLSINREAKNNRKANAFPIHPGVWSILLSLSIGVVVDVDTSVEGRTRRRSWRGLGVFARVMRHRNKKNYRTHRGFTERTAARFQPARRKELRPFGSSRRRRGGGLPRVAAHGPRSRSRIT